MIQKLLVMILGLMTLGCCPQAAASGAPGDKTLIVYFSQTGATRRVAEELRSQLGGCDMAEIMPEQPYDGDYDATIARWRAELESGDPVGIKPLDVNLDSYDTVFLGFPIWGGAAALPVMSFLRRADLSGKRVVTFATFGSGGIGNATHDIARLQPQARVEQGYGVRNARLASMPSELTTFLISRGFIQGQVAALPDYSAPEPVTAAEVEIFDRACGNYKYPLGTPVKVGKRLTATSVDYRFEVASTAPDGTPVVAVIFVTAPLDPASAPEFTEVIR